MNQREIKFKAWDKEKEKMFKVSEIMFDVELVLDEESRPQDFENIHLLQYTNLKDKNGKEIYEGDVVKVQSISVPNYIGKVVFSEGAFWIEGEEGKGDLVCIPLKIEVIGDIYQGVLPKYENPDILKECPKELKDFKKDTKLAKKQEKKSV